MSISHALDETHDTTGSVPSLVSGHVTSGQVRSSPSALTNEVVISGTRSDIPVVPSVVNQRVITLVSSRVVLVVPSVGPGQAGTDTSQAGVVLVRVSETSVRVTQTGGAGVETLTLLAGDRGGLAVVQVAGDGRGGGTGSGKVGSGVLEGLSAGGSEEDEAKTMISLDAWRAR